MLFLPLTVITTLRLKICIANNTEHGDPEVWEPHINVFVQTWFQRQDDNNIFANDSNGNN